MAKKKKAVMLQDIMAKILSGNPEDVTEQVTITDDMEVIMNIFVCFCGYYWTGNSLRIGVTDGKKAEKGKICYKCADTLILARSMLGRKVSVQSKPTVTEKLEKNQTVLKRSDDHSEQDKRFSEARLTEEQVIYILETAQNNVDVILDGLPEREKLTKKAHNRDLIIGKSNLLISTRKGWIKSSKQTYRIKQYRDILKDNGLLPHLNNL